MSAGWTPRVSSRAACLPEATGRCQRLSASVCHRSPVSTDSAGVPSHLCRSEFPSGLWSETPRQRNWPHISALLCATSPFLTDTHRDATNTRSRCPSCRTMWIWASTVLCCCRLMKAGACRFICALVYVCASTSQAVFEWQRERGAARRRRFVRVHLPSPLTSPSRQQTVTADSPYKRKREQGGRGYED